MSTFFANHAESFFWIAAQLALGILGVALWPRLRPALGQNAEALAAGTRLLYSLLIPYLALLLGSISARDTGLVGLDAMLYTLGNWLGAFGWAAVWAALAFAAYAWGHMYPGATPGMALLDEFRWAFYRGAAIGWVGAHSTFGVLLGLGVAAIEWGALRGLRTALGESNPPALGWLARAWLSAFVFLFTRNLWLTLAVGAFVPFALARWRARHA